MIVRIEHIVITTSYIKMNGCDSGVFTSLSKKQVTNVKLSLQHSAQGLCIRLDQHIKITHCNNNTTMHHTMHITKCRHDKKRVQVLPKIFSHM